MWAKSTPLEGPALALLLPCPSPRGTVAGPGKCDHPELLSPSHPLDPGLPVQTDTSLLQGLVPASHQLHSPKGGAAMVHTLRPERLVAKGRVVSCRDMMACEVRAGVSLAMWERIRWEKGDGLDHGMVGFDNTLWHRPESENSKFELGLPGSYMKVGGQNIFELGLIYKKY